MSTRKIEYTEGSGNVYQDLGFADSEEHLAKAKLAMRIEEVIDKKKLKQSEAAKILEINQPKVSALMNGQLSGFSMERLIHFLNLLNQDVEIIVRNKPPRRKAQGHLAVAFA
jgi:predicted XRE-type DNA-binding protein